MEREKVKKYFERMGLELPEQIVPDSALLRELQFAHCTHIPYENLDIIRGIPLSLDVDDLYKKIVEEGKGGFCFELNGLFAWLLRELGYGVTEYAARYLRGEKEKHIDLSQALVGFSASDADGSIALALDTRSSNAGALRPLVLVEAALARLGEGTCDSVRVRRCGQWHEDESGCLVKPL